MVFPFSTLVKPICFSHGACYGKILCMITTLCIKSHARSQSCSSGTSPKDTSPESWCDLNRNAPCFGGFFTAPSRRTWIFTRLWNWPRLMRSRSSAGEELSWLNHTEHLNQHEPTTIGTDQQCASVYNLWLLSLFIIQLTISIGHFQDILMTN